VGGDGEVKNGSEEGPICVLIATERFWFGGEF